MRRFFPLALLVLTGCGFHTYENHTETPNLVVESKNHVGWFSSSSDTKIVPRGSRYRTCHAEYDGMPGADRFCQCRLWAENPGSFTGAYYGGYYYGAGSDGFYAFCSPYYQSKASSE